MGKGHQELIPWFHSSTKAQTLLGHQTAAASQLGCRIKRSTELFSILLAVLESLFPIEGCSDENSQVLSSQQICGIFCMPFKEQVYMFIIMLIYFCCH